MVLLGGTLHVLFVTLYTGSTVDNNNLPSTQTTTQKGPDRPQPNRPPYHFPVLRHKKCPTDPPGAPLNLLGQTPTPNTRSHVGSLVPSVIWPLLTMCLTLLPPSLRVKVLLKLGQIRFISPLPRRMTTSLVIHGTPPSPLLTLLGQTPRLSGLRSTPPSCFPTSMPFLVLTRVRLLARS